MGRAADDVQEVGSMHELKAEVNTFVRLRHDGLRIGLETREGHLAPAALLSEA